MKKGLVSFLVPYYNSEEYLPRFLDSLLSQTYDKIQVILVNDGSKDNSRDVVEAYKGKLKKKFEDLILLDQDNMGQAAAINLGLKRVEGEYLSWADSDDELYPDNIKKKVEFLADNPEYGYVICGAERIYSNSKNKNSNLSIPQHRRKINMFNEILIRGIPCYSGVCMTRSDLLFAKLKDRNIDCSRLGQNFQLYLPIAYDNKCGFIDEILYAYIIRDTSHFRCTSYHENIERTYERERLIQASLSFLTESELKKYMKVIHNSCLLRRFNLAYEAGDFRECQKAYKELEKKNVFVFINYLKLLFKLRKNDKI